MKLVTVAAGFINHTAVLLTIRPVKQNIDNTIAEFKTIDLFLQIIDISLYSSRYIVLSPHFTKKISSRSMLDMDSPAIISNSVMPYALILDGPKLLS